MKFLLLFIQAGALHGLAITFRSGLSSRARRVSGSTSARSWSMEKFSSFGSVWSVGMSS